MLNGFRWLFTPSVLWFDSIAQGDRMSTDERLPAEERGGSTDKPEREYVISNRPDDPDAMPGPDDAEDDDEVDDADDAEDDDEDDATTS
jgi:hypothetical protein